MTQRKVRADIIREFLPQACKDIVLLAIVCDLLIITITSMIFYQVLYTVVIFAIPLIGLKDVLLDCTVYVTLCTPVGWVKKLTIGGSILFALMWLAVEVE
ncbi:MULTISPECIES: hypothetical protein [Calothrix]|uniref:Uncharacterized protein n=2 Tax=Calothrix TaxID=1186 RepID=A0ABR8ANB1_9CYAN|nr:MULTISPECIES: hypothetical protein [Calothrix]MBD2200171.1 hypothetical protein [Calothrix parietina FACHB-288]MBD2229119.1 hypothetical protein [Calothrix anomala FACHB-343]